MTTNNPNRRNRTQFAITHAIIVSWAIALLAPFVLFLIPMCTPDTFLHYTFYFAFAVVLVLLIPITINCRGRLHDVGHTGSYMLRVFLPFSKVFKLLWSEGDAEENQFGAPPHYKIPRVSYFVKILLAQGIVFSLVALARSGEFFGTITQSCNHAAGMTISKFACSSTARVFALLTTLCI